MILPFRTKNPPESLPAVTCGLIALNVLIYAFTSNGLEIKESILKQWGMTSRTFDAPHFLSSLFLHGDIFHLLGNMLFLYLFGFAVEGRLKSVKFLILYFAAGLAGDVAHHYAFAIRHPDIPSIGASGAIMGLVGAAVYMFPHAKVSVFYWFGLWWRGVFDAPMWGVALYYLGFDVLFAFLGAADGVAHLAHVGGAVGGAVVAMLFRPTRDSELASDAKATLAETKDLATLSRLELEELHRVKPDDPVIVMNWVHRSNRDPGGIRKDCVETFFRLLPRMLQEQDVRAVATCLRMMPDSHAVKPGILLQMAAQLERVGDHATAASLYEGLQSHPEATEADHQAAAFRTAVIAETAFQDFKRAYAWYSYVVDKWPMGPFAEQSKSRMQVMSQPKPHPR